MDYLNYLTLFAAVANFLLGLTVFTKNKNKGLNISFFIFSLINALWALSNFYFFSFGKDLTVFRLVYSTGGAVPILAVPWFLYLVDKPPNMYKKIILYLASLIIFITPLFDGFVIQDIFKVVGDTYEFTPGIFFNLFSILVITSLLYLFFILVPQYVRSHGNKKTQLLYVLIGTSLFAFVGILFGLILPFFDIAHVVPYDAQASIFFVGFSSYAIIRHRLMDIRMVVARSVAYTILVAMVGFFYVAMMIWVERLILPSMQVDVSLAQTLFRVTVVLFIVFTFQPLRKFITKKTDKIFFKQSYDSEKLLDTLAHTMGSTIILVELLHKVLSILTEEMKISRGIFIILKDEKTVDVTQSIGYKKTPEIIIKELHDISKDCICVYDEIGEGSRAKAILRRHNASVAIPLKSHDELKGVLFIGEKSSGDMYSSQDIRIFEILGPEITVAIDNAMSYEEIQQFNIVLRERVKHATKDLKEANENLRELDKAKDEFISMASHQLRTPLTAIKGYLSMLLEGDAGEVKKGQHEFVEEAYFGATRMVSLINDLLNVSRMETGKFFLEMKEFDLKKAIDEEMKQLEKTAKDKGVKLVFKKAKDVTLCADEMKIRQVIMNFTDNAIYYTPKGKITLRLYEDGDKVCFEVTDNGIGVPKDVQKKLFTKFYRAENARSTRPDGTGLGLFMAKKVIDEHHGEIIFHSEEGKGSTFGFKLPKKAKVLRGSNPDFGKNIPADTKVDKAIKIMDEKVKEEIDKEEMLVGGKK